MNQLFQWSDKTIRENPCHRPEFPIGAPEFVFFLTAQFLMHLGMPNTRESAILAAAVEAVEWKHPIEPVSEDGKRHLSH
jgi:hypothetical protein